MTVETHDERETWTVAKQFAATLKSGEVVCVEGDLGAGKTTFTQGLCAALGAKRAVTSPTFTLVHEYRGETPLIHFDMYRISGFDELYSTGFFDYLEGNAVLSIEWSENIEEDLPEDTIRIDFEISGENERRITIRGGERFVYPCG